MADFTPSPPCISFPPFTVEILNPSAHSNHVRWSTDLTAALLYHGLYDFITGHEPEVKNPNVIGIMSTRYGEIEDNINGVHLTALKAYQEYRARLQKCVGMILGSVHWKVRRKMLKNGVPRMEGTGWEVGDVRKLWTVLQVWGKGEKS